MTETGRTTSIGIDIGGTNLRFALVADDGSILHRERQLTNIQLGRAEFLRRLSGGIATMQGWAANHGIAVQAIGAGVPGLIDMQGNVLSSVNLGPIEGLNLRDALSRASGLPVVVANDANASAWGEKRYGAGRPYATVLMLTLGTGVGSGLILDGKLWTGIDGVAGEFGHVTVEPEGTPCRCGNRGCLEQYASAGALMAAASKELSDGRRGEVDSAEELATAARGGDPFAITLFERAGRYLGIGLAGAVNLLNLEAIVLGGGVAASFDLLIAPLRRELNSRAFAVNAARVRIVRGQLGDDAGLLGAAALARDASQTE